MRRNDEVANFRVRSTIDTTIKQSSPLPWMEVLLGIMSMCLGSTWVKADGRLPES